MKRLLTLLSVFIMIPFLAFAQNSQLKPGSTGKNVLELQQRLQELGLNPGAADGVYGDQTSAGVMEAQRLLKSAGYDVPENGIADEKTLILLFDAESESSLKTLRSGSKGSRVKELQNRLIDLGLLKTSPDGVFGSKTKEAVLAFQKLFSPNDIDGAVTPDLWNLMMSDLSASKLQTPVYFDESKPSLLTPSNLYAPACILIDAPSGKVLLERNADQQMYPASTTKVITLLLALQKTAPDQVVTIPQSAADVPADSSLVPVYPGETMTMRDLLNGMMICSGNDAANAVAEICAGNVDLFADHMNAFAAETGMTSSHFTNPHGYHDPEHYTTARDLAGAVRLGLTDPVFCQFVTCMNYTMAPTEKRDELTLKNKWEIFDPESEFYIPGAAGVKSGFTSSAGFCYAGAAQRGGRTLIAVVLGETTRNRAWIDLRRLFEYGFELEY